MKFLVTGEGIDYGGPVDPKVVAMNLENVINPSLEIVEGWVKENKAQGGLLAGQRQGVFIIEAGSAEELGAMLQSLPFWGIIKWSVVPMESLRSRIEMQKKIVEKLKQAPSGMGPTH
jgi:hypothetical protein